MAMTSHPEIERKYDVPDDATVPRFDGLDRAGVRSASETERFELVATYFDTADGALAARRMTLRRRTGGSDAGWHLKLPAEAGRSELGWPVELRGSDAGSPVPAEVLEPVRGIVRDHPLAPVAIITTHRSVTRLLGDGGAELVEIADDTVSASDVRSGVLRTWREWEAELLDGANGDQGLLDAVQDALVEAGARPAASASKLATAMGRTGLGDEEPAPSVDAHSPASDVLLVPLRALIREVATIDTAVRLDETDSVHRMRTRIRRLRSLLAGYPDVFDRTVAEGLDDELRRVGGVLGEARDVEVMRGLVAELASVGQPVRGTLLSDFDGTAARTRVLAELGSERYFRMLDALDDFAARPALAVKATAAADEVVPPAIRKQSKRVLKRARRADAESDPTEKVALLHRTRKAAKRLRYMAEAVTEGDSAVFGKRLRRIASAANNVHDVLGDHRDSAQLQEHLRSAAARSGHAFDYGVIHERERIRSAALLDEYSAAIGALEKLRSR